MLKVLFDMTTKKTWGRAKRASTSIIVISLLILSLAPVLVAYFHVTMNKFKGDLSSAVYHVFSEQKLDLVPVFSWKVSGMVLFWILFQIMLYVFLPGKQSYGQMTPAGHQLQYKTNGLFAWGVSVFLFCILSIFGYGAVIAQNFGSIFIAANIYGYLLSIFVYFKAIYKPSHSNDCKYSGSRIYDFYMGIEFNPRINSFDFKLFHNGRPGIIGWSLISASFGFLQYINFGSVSNSMVLVNILHNLYIVDFFYHEDWYLRTIDICHDHFGFYLAWGDSVWLPFLYTLQSQYLAFNYVDLSNLSFFFIFSLGVLGYVIFRTTNNQKDKVRKTNGKCLIFNKRPKILRLNYKTTDGNSHKTLLLYSGFWGMSRHMNYLGDLLISLAMCLACGFNHISPYFYIIYMVILLINRIYRDDERCRQKYGNAWEEYCKLVPFKLIPFVF